MCPRSDIRYMRVSQLSSKHTRCSDIQFALCRPCRAVLYHLKEMALQPVILNKDLHTYLYMELALQPQLILDTDLYLHILFLDMDLYLHMPHIHILYMHILPYLHMHILDTILPLYLHMHLILNIVIMGINIPRLVERHR